MEHSVKEFFFGPETALSHVGIWGKKLFVALGYSLIDEERKEGGKKNRSKWNLNTLLAERSTKERNMRAKTKTGSQDGLKSAVHSILWVSVDGEIRLKPTAKHCLISIVSIPIDIHVVKLSLP